jgi:ATP-binding cassette subfamily B protein
MPNVEPKKNYSSKTFKIYWEHVKKYPWSVTSLGFFTVLGLAAQLYMPFLYKNFFNILGQNVRTPAVAAVLFSIILGVLLFNVINWACYRTISFVNNYFQGNTMRDITNTCFAYLHDHSFNFFSSNFAGSLQRKVNRFSRSFEDIGDLIVWDATPAFLRVLIVIVVLLYQYPKLGLAVLVWSIIHTTFNYYFTLYKLRHDLEKSEVDTKLSGYLADTISNNTNIKLFTNLEIEKTGYASLAQKWYTIARRAWDLDAISYSIQGFLMVLMEFFVFYIGLGLWQAGKFQIGDFVFMQSYVIMTFNSVWNFSRYLKRFYESMSDANEMTEILETPHEVQDVPNAPLLHVAAGEVEFKNVGYSYYTGTSIYENFDLKIAGGEKIALIGPSGGGKSTFVKLLLRFHDLTNGQILIDGQDIAGVTQDSLRHSVSLVPQDPILFHRSIMENIRYAKPDAADAEVLEAARLAHCHEFISGFPDKYETFVGERGIKLSGGERQRVAIARAILKNAPILVLDEATSSLDSESERLIQDALDSLMRGKTVIVIAHRLSTVMQMDRIVVIEAGKIKEQGKHEELLKLETGTYQRLWNIQAGGFAASADE